MRKLLKGIDALNKAVKALLGIFLIIMSVVIIVQVIFRFGLHAALPWSEELTRYLMIYIVFIGAGYAARYGQLMRVELLEMMLPQKMRNWYMLFMGVIMVAAMAVIIVAGGAFVKMAMSQRSPSLQIPMAVVYFSIPLGGALMVVNVFASVAERFLQGEKVEDKEGIDGL